MKKNILLISFDFVKESYSQTTYSVATIMSSLKHDKELNSLSVEHYGINLSEIYRKYTKNIQLINNHIKNKLCKDIIPIKNNYDFIAIGVTTWSNIYVKYLTRKILSDFSGTLILAGYEITATEDYSLIKNYPNVDYFIKGYAETALKKIILNKYPPSLKVIHEKLNITDLKSPYTTRLLSAQKKKIHWETKRGCPYRCGFCEWGNAANKKVIPISSERLHKEIALFKTLEIEEINILDGTFNFGSSYIYYLKKLLTETKANITMQVRFENIESHKGGEFLKVCKKYPDRIKLEFGLQTIHPEEMEVIGRKNNLEKIKSAMHKLNKYGIHYEVSLIYGIPGQTYESFQGTIEFVLNNGCNIIRAFPLRIPRNSKMYQQKKSLKIRETQLEYNIEHVTSSYSFDEKEYLKMQQLSNKIESITDFQLTNSKHYIFKEDNPYEWKLKNAG